MIEFAQPAGDATCPRCGCLLWITDTAGEQEIFAFHKFSISERSIVSKAQAIEAILDKLVGAEALHERHRHEVLAAILKREELGSTGIGHGLAIPHAQHPGVGNLLGAVARFSAGVNFDSLDGQPVNLVCLLVSPEGRPGGYMGVLEALSRRLREAG